MILIMFISWAWMILVDNQKVCREEKTNVEVEKLRGDEEVNAKSSDVSSSSSVIPCIDRLREELSCAVRVERIDLIYFLCSLM